MDKQPDVNPVESMTHGEEANHQAMAGGHIELSGYPVPAVEPEYPEDLIENDLATDELAESATKFADQLLVTPLGIFTFSEMLKLAGVAATVQNKAIPAALPLFNHSGEVEQTAHVVRCGCRKMFELQTRTGGLLKTPAKHRVMVMNAQGWWVVREVGDIPAGDHIMVRRTFDGAIGTPSHFSLDALYVLGIIIADGTIHKNRVMISNDDPVVQTAIVQHGPEIFGRNPLIYSKAGQTGSLAYHFNSTAVVNKLYGVLGWEPCRAAGKKLGHLLRSLDTDGVRAVLQGYVDCECTLTDACCIVISSASRRLLMEVKLALLAHFGIISVLRYLKCAQYAENDYWILTLSGEEAASYIEQVGFRSKQRQEQVQLWIDKDRNPNIDVIPRLGGLLTAIHGWSETTREHVTLVRDYKGDNARADVTYQRLKRILDAAWSDTPALDRLRQINAARFFYDEVVSAKQVESEPAFDFDMPQSHSYIINGFATRNSADRVACSMDAAA